MKKLLLTLFTLIALSCYAQDLRLGKVSRAELEQKVHPTEPDAAAAILFKKGKTNFVLDMDGYWSMVTEVECRIKIYNKEGYKYATDKLVYYTGGKTVKAFYSDAVTYNLENGEVEKTKLKGDGEFKEKVEENYNQKTITMPNVKEGSVIEYKYTISTPYFTVFKDWYFQYDIPANFVSYEVAVPLYFVYNRFMSGYVKVDQSKTDVRMGVGGRFNESVVTFTAKDVKAIKDEDYVNNIKNYTSILMHELASTNFPSGKEEYATDWPSVVKRIYDDKDFGKELEYTSYFKNDLPALTIGKTQEEKADILFSYVKARMNWNGETSYYCEKGVKKAYEDKTGNAAEINLMLTAMLREAGINAHPVLVSTRANGVALFPNRAAYNYVVAAIERGKDIILLDATSKNTAPNILPVRALNWVGRMIRKDGSSLEIDLVPKINSKEIVNMAAAIQADGSVSGKIRKQYHDHYAYVFREKYSGVNTESMASKLEQQYKGVEVSDYKMPDDKDVAKPVTEEYSFTHTTISEVIGDKIYINPMLFFTAAETPFKKETREYPIDFTFPHQDKYMLNITIPDGYTVESLPKPIALAMEEKIGTFKYNIAIKGNVIQAGIVFEINYANVSQDYYTTLRDFYQKMIEKQNEKIVLKKV